MTEKENTQKKVGNKGSGKTLSACCHLAGFGGGFIFPLGGLLFAPLVWAFGAFIADIDEEEISLLNNHGKEALNFRISLLVYALIAGFAMFGISIVAALIGTHLSSDPMMGLAIGFGGIMAGGMSLSILLTIIVVIFDFICVMRAIVHAFQGKQTHYPLTIHFLK